VVGIDTGHHAGDVMAQGFPARMSKEGRTAIDVMYDANRFGQKNGKGFYAYEQDKKGKPKKVADAALRAAGPIAKPKQDFDKDAIIARMMIPMINEVVLCLEEGIVATPAEADIALVYGLGFLPSAAACSAIWTLSVWIAMSPWPTSMPTWARSTASATSCVRWPPRAKPSTDCGKEIHS
jgi:hypothetical protein